MRENEGEREREGGLNSILLYKIVDGVPYFGNNYKKKKGVPNSVIHISRRGRNKDYRHSR